MIQSKKIDIIIVIIVVFALITSLTLVAIGSSSGTKREPEYAEKIFGADIISIEIIADEEDWQEMLNNATREQFIMVDVIVNGTKFQSVGIRPKGNSSLSQVASSNSDRYSFRLQFDEYIKGQTCFGLDSFVVNNMLGDNTYMKEYVSYELMREIGVDAPYFGYADIKVNGESWGFYLAVETYGDSYEARTFGTTAGMMYNVKSMDIGGNNNGFNFPQGGMQPPTGGQGEQMPSFPQGGWGRPPDTGWGNFPQGMQPPTGEQDEQVSSFPQGGMQPPTGGQSEQMPSFPQGGMQPPTGGQDEQMPSIPQGGMQPPTGGQGEQVPSFRQGGAWPPTGGQGNRMAPDAAGGFNPQGGFQPPMNEREEQSRPEAQADSNASDTTRSTRQGNTRQMGMPDGNFGGFMGGRGGNGGSLQYTTDDISSYGSIFNNVVGKGTEADYKRVITALKKLSEGDDLETYFDVDQILRYLAAHTVVVNLDSYSSSMAQNYYLYEYKGKVTILPWDYNLSWGGFQSGNASAVINFPIDTPVSGVTMSSRPLIDKLFSNPEYFERYHDYLQELMTTCFADGKWEERIAQLDALISDYVKNDQTAFCTYEAYKTAVESFKTLGSLRYQSIQGQLNGTVPSTTEAQSANPDKLIPAGNLNLSSLGSMGFGRNMANRQGDRSNPQEGEGFGFFGMENMPDTAQMMQIMRIIQDANGTITDEVRAELLEQGLTEEQISMFSQMAGRFGLAINGNNRAGRNAGMVPAAGNVSPSFGNRAPAVTGTTNNLLLYIGLFALLMLSTFIVARKKRSY